MCLPHYNEWKAPTENNQSSCLLINRNAIVLTDIWHFQHTLYVHFTVIKSQKKATTWLVSLRSGDLSMRRISGFSKILCRLKDDNFSQQKHEECLLFHDKVPWNRLTAWWLVDTKSLDSPIKSLFISHFSPSVSHFSSFLCLFLCLSLPNVLPLNLYLRYISASPELTSIQLDLLFKESQYEGWGEITEVWNKLFLTVTTETRGNWCNLLHSSPLLSS